MIINRNSNGGRTLMCSACHETEVIIEPHIPRMLIHELPDGEFLHIKMDKYFVRFNDLDAFVVCGKCRGSKVFKEL